MATTDFEERLQRYANAFAPVIPYAKDDKFLRLDFTVANPELTDELLKDTNRFTDYVNRRLREAGATYGIGGYGEDRVIYRRSEVFGGGPTRLPEGEVPQSQPSLFNDAGSAKGPLQSGPRSEAPMASLSGRSGGAASDRNAFGYHWAAPNLYGILQEYALKNRAHPTEAETILWEAIKNKKLGPYKFRRQFIIDKYIADFVCLERRLVIEIDGSIHQLPENKEADAVRTNELNEKGFAVLRFPNDEVLHNLEASLHTIKNALNSLPSVQRQSNDHQVRVDFAPEPRSVHLGIDIWGAPHTRVMAPLDGIVHSFAFNNAFGDYGATIILTHNLEGETFHTLYGHLSLNSLKNLQEGQNVYKGDVFAEFGLPFENGQWPPHLHFQIIKDMKGMKGDYAGVCAVSEREGYLKNCPDADVILGLMPFAV